MSYKKFLTYGILYLVIIFICSCEENQIILHTKIIGTVTDANDSTAIQGANVILSRLNDTTIANSNLIYITSYLSIDSLNTEIDGKYLFTSLAPGNYEIQVSKSNYSLCSRQVSTTSGKTYQIDFTLNRIKKPVANFDSIPPGCEPLSLTINNTTWNTDVEWIMYFWDFGDGSFSNIQYPSHTWISGGTFKVELTVVSSFGYSIKSQIINVYPSPLSYFVCTPTTVLVNSESVQFFNFSTGADNYLWEFGNGETSIEIEPFHIYKKDGIYDVTLWAYSDNGCSDKYTLSPAVTVTPSGK